MNVGLMLKMNIYLISVIMHFGCELLSIISTFHIYILNIYKKTYDNYFSETCNSDIS